jgi:hypothetical protein
MIPQIHGDPPGEVEYAFFYEDMLERNVLQNVLRLTSSMTKGDAKQDVR